MYFILKRKYKLTHSPGNQKEKRAIDITRRNKQIRGRRKNQSYDRRKVYLTEEVFVLLEQMGSLNIRQNKQKRDRHQEKSQGKIHISDRILSWQHSPQQ